MSDNAYLESGAPDERTLFDDLNAGPNQPDKQFVSDIQKGIFSPVLRIQSMKDSPGGSWNPADRPIKEWTRHVVARTVAGKNKKRCLVLPASTGRDIELLKYYNATASNCNWICVEGEAKIRNYFTRKSVETGLFTPEEKHHHPTGMLHKYISSEPFDFAWFDFFGNLRWPELSWFLDLFQTRFLDGTVPDMDLFFTFAGRGSFRGYGDILFKMVLNAVTDFGSTKTPGILSHFGIEDLVHREFLSIKNTREFDPETCRFNSHEDVDSFSGSCSMDSVAVAQLLMLRYIFTGYHNLLYDVNIYMYQDENHHEMLLYHLSNFRSVSKARGETYARPLIDAIRQLSNYAIHKDDKVAELINSYLAKEHDIETSFEASDIKRWRRINKLPAADAIADFNMGVELENNLYRFISKDEEFDPEDYVDVLLERLEEYYTFSVHYDEVDISKLSKGLKIKTQTTREVFDFNYYKIEVGEKTVWHDDHTITLSPHFLHPDNKTALFAVFRNIFAGDLHLITHFSGLVPGMDGIFIESEPQWLAIDSWNTSWNRGERAGAIILPTGMGKTSVAINIAKNFFRCPALSGGGAIRPPKCKNKIPAPWQKPRKAVEQRKGGRDCRMLFLAHRAEILNQAVKRFSLNPKDKDPAFVPEEIGIAYATTYDPEITALQKSKGGWSTAQGKLNQLNSKAVFATVNSLHKCLDLIQDPSHFSLVIVDEAHHLPATTWHETLDRFGIRPNSGPEYLLGLTATPFRLDNKDVFRLFHSNSLYQMSLKRAYYLGYLVWPDYKLAVDQTAYKEGFSKAEQINEDERKEEIVKRFQKHAKELKTIGFCSNVKEAKEWARYFTEVMGISAATIHSKTPAEDRIAFRNAFELPAEHPDAIQVLFVKDLFNEGVDVTGIEAVMLLRKTQSAIKHFQQLGRGLRLNPGKRKLVVLDFMSNYHGDTDMLLDAMAWLNVIRPSTKRDSETDDLEEDLDEDLELEPGFVPKTRFTLGEDVMVVVRNELKRQEKLEEYKLYQRVYRLRKQNRSLDEMMNLPKIQGNSQAKVVRMAGKADDELSVDKSELELQREYLMTLHKALAKGFTTGLSKDALRTFASELTEDQFELLWDCVINDVPPHACIDSLL